MAATPITTSCCCCSCTTVSGSCPATRPSCLACLAAGSTLPVIAVQAAGRASQAAGRALQAVGRRGLLLAGGGATTTIALGRVVPTLLAAGGQGGVAVGGAAAGTGHVGLKRLVAGHMGRKRRALVLILAPVDGRRGGGRGSSKGGGCSRCFSDPAGGCGQSGAHTAS
jgi:hypothetical protein